LCPCAITIPKAVKREATEGSKDREEIMIVSEPSMGHDAAKGTTFVLVSHYVTFIITADSRIQPKLAKQQQPRDDST
jgi:hypothetical protein